MAEHTIQDLVQNQRDYFNSGVTRSISFRKEMLKRLRKAVLDREAELLKALKQDLGKSDFEAFATEVSLALKEIDIMIRHCGKWTKTRREPVGLFNIPGKGRVYHDPHGVCLIMSPWNYPFYLTITPLIGAIAGGNTAVVKPSAYAKATQDFFAELVASSFDPSYISVIRGGREENKKLLDQHFDYIFFTGGTEVGKIVMESAAKFLCPVTLELGGKSPCIIDQNVDIDMAARRAVWGKCINSGQTCVAPDYFLVHKSVHDAFIERMKVYIERFYGTQPLGNAEFPHIINKKHFDRLKALIDAAETEGATIVSGGKTDPESLKIEPTIVSGVSENHPLMQEELFGPIMPILSWESRQDLVALLLQKPRPLALYVFTGDSSFSKELIRRIPFGGGCINDTVMHLASHNLPFGGTGTSGMGSYHGKASIRTFTREKPVLIKGFKLDVPLRYAPFAGKYRNFRSLM